jgi:O-antigen/teichoic acid export membrane protein
MLKNIGANWFQLVASILVTTYLLPFTLHALGTEQYGLWLLVTSITGYLSILVLGVPMACVRLIATHAGDADRTALNKAVASSAGLCALLGSFALVAGIALFGFFSTYDISPALWPTARTAFLIVVINTALTFVGQLPECIFAAHEAFVVRNQIAVGSLLLRLALTVALLRANASILVLALVLVACFLFEVSVSLVVLRRRYPHIRPRIADINWATSRSIFGFSLYVVVLTVGSQLSFQTDAIVIGQILGVDQIPFFSTAGALAIYLMQFAIAIASVVLPTATRLSAQNKTDELRTLFLKWSKITMSLTLLASLFLLILGPQFLGWWVGPEFVGPGGTVLRILMVANLVFLPIRGVGLPILMGIGSPRLPAIGFAVAGLANVVLSIILGKMYGLAGVAWGTAIPNIVYAAFLLRLSCRTLGVRITDYLRHVVPKATLGSIPAVAVLLYFSKVSQVRGLLGLVIAGVAMSLVFAAAWILYVYRKDPHIDLLSRIRPLLPQTGG